jgi:hypothetical protein
MTNTPIATCERAAAPVTSTNILISDSGNPLTINSFKGVTPVMSALNEGLLSLSFPGTEDPDIFVVTGLLKNHDMTVIKDVPLFPPSKDNSH